MTTLILTCLFILAIIAIILKLICDLRLHNEKRGIMYIELATLIGVIFLAFMIFSEPVKQYSELSNLEQITFVGGSIIAILSFIISIIGFLYKIICSFKKK